MYFIVLSIIFNAYVGIIFKYFGKWNVNALVAIVVNYFFCIITGSVILGKFPFTPSNAQSNWFPFSLGVGVLLILVFYLMSIASVKIGVTLTQAANKMSLAIPVFFSLYLYNESVNGYKIAGLLLAFIGVYFITLPKNTNNKQTKNWILLPLLFIGSGLIDTLTKYIEYNFISNQEQLNLYVIHSFTAAALLGTLYILFNSSVHKKITIRSIMAGILLGIPNYFSIYFLVRALQYRELDSSSIIPINNIGILLVVTIYGLLIFHEKLSVKNKVGLGLAAASIIFLLLSN